MLQRAARLRPQDIVKVLMKGLSDLNKQNLELKDRILHQDAMIKQIGDQLGCTEELMKTTGIMSKILSKFKACIMNMDDGWGACIDQLKDRVDKMQKISSLISKPAECEGSNTDRERAVRGPPVQITAPSPSRERI